MYLALLASLSVALPAQEAIVDDIDYAIDNFDTDADGRVSREEFRGEPIDFLRLDLDGSGTIDEIDRALARERVVVPTPLLGPRSGPSEETPRREFDEVVLLGGGLLRGEVQVDHYDLQTVYGRLRIPAHRVASFDLEAAPDRVDRIVCVNGDRFSGVALEAGFEVLLDGAEDPIRISREKILRIEMRTPDDEALGRHQFVVMKNGDRFSARLASDRLSLRTLYGEFSLDPERLDRIEMVGNDRSGTIATFLEGETITGLLDPEILLFDLDILEGIEGSDAVSIHHCRVETFYAREGFIPPEAPKPSSPAEETTPLLFDFEAGLEGWTVEGAQTTWFHTTAEAARGEASMECAGQGALAYTNGANATLTSPIVELSGGGARSLGFYRRYETEESYDFLRVEVSYDAGINWIELVTYSGMANWERVELPLSPDAERVTIRFRFQTDESEVGRGVWIDGVEVVQKP
jgi:hypothetical protein